MLPPSALPERLELTAISDHLRKERRALLSVTVMACAMTYGGFTPTQVDQLGIRFAPHHTLTLHIIVVTVQVYLLVEFVLHSKVEKVAWLRYLSKLRDQALPSLAASTGRLDAATLNGEKAALEATIRELEGCVNNVQTLISTPAFRASLAALDGYRLLAARFGAKSATKSPGIFAEVANDIAAVRVIYDWHPAPDVTERREAQRAVLVLAGRMLCYLDNYMEMAARVHRHNPILKGLRLWHFRILRRQLLKILIELDNFRIDKFLLDDLRWAWRRLFIDPLFWFWREPWLRYIDNDVRKMRSWVEAHDWQPFVGNLDHDELSVFRGILLCPSALNEVEQSLSGVFRRLSIRAWFDFDLPIFVGVAGFVALVVYITRLAA